VTGQADASERLAAERASALERLNGLERELRGIIESADTAGTDDEHDPEGATIAFERQYVAALLDQAREHLAQIDAPCGSWRRAPTAGASAAARTSAPPASPPAPWLPRV